MKHQHLTELDDADVLPYRSLRNAERLLHDGVFVAEGEKVVRALLATDYPIVSMLMSTGRFEQLADELSTRLDDDTVVYTAPDELVDGIVGFTMHKRLMALARIPENPSHEDFILPGRRVYVALQNVADAENMGMILRNAAAFGVDGVLHGPDCSSPWLRRSVRVSVGHQFALRIRRCDELLSELRLLRERFGLRIIGTSPRGGSPRVLARAAGNDARPLCLLFGSEAHGLTDEALALCDEVFSIPMRNGVDSLNIANALAVALFLATEERSQHE